MGTGIADSYTGRKSALIRFIGHVPPEGARDAETVGELLYRKVVGQVRALGCLSREEKRHTFFLVGHPDLAVSTSLSAFPMQRITKDIFLDRASNALGKPLAGHAVIYPGEDGEMHWLFRWGRSRVVSRYSDVMSCLPSFLEGRILTFFRCVNRVGRGRCREVFLDRNTPDATPLCPKCKDARNRKEEYQETLSLLDDPKFSEEVVSLTRGLACGNVPKEDARGILEDVLARFRAKGGCDGHAP